MCERVEPVHIVAILRSNTPSTIPIQKRESGVRTMLMTGTGNAPSRNRTWGPSSRERALRSEGEGAEGAHLASRQDGHHLKECSTGLLVSSLHGLTRRVRIFCAHSSAVERCPCAVLGALGECHDDAR